MAGRNPVILIGGGVRCGKSAFGLARARELGARRAFVATAQGLDADMRDRIARHRDERGDEFRTVEEPLALAAALASLREVDVVVVDCLTMWLSNLLVRGDGLDQVSRQIDALCETLARCPFAVVLVTNEVGMGVVPDTALGRAFRDLSGTAHQRIAGRADEVYFAVLGVLLRIKPEPIALQHEWRIP